MGFTKSLSLFTGNIAVITALVFSTFMAGSAYGEDFGWKDIGKSGVKVRITTDHLFGKSDSPKVELASRKLATLKVEFKGKAKLTKIDARMPEHNHGMNVKPKIIELKAMQTYRVDGMKLHMPGDWVFYLEFEIAGKQEKLEFDFNI